MMTTVREVETYFENDSTFLGVWNQLTGETAEISEFRCISNAASQLNGRYLLLSSPYTDYYVWFSTAGVGTDPQVSGRTGLNVDFTGPLVSDITTASQVAAGINAHADFTATNTNQVVTVTNVYEGVCTDIAAGTSGFTNFSVTQQGAWGQKYDKIIEAERYIARRKFVGIKSSSTQSDPFPRDFTYVIDYIATYMSQLDEYDDIYQAYTDVDGIVPQRVKNAVCEQIKYMLLTDDFIMERITGEQFFGQITTGNATINSVSRHEVCINACRELDPFLVKPNRVQFYAFGS